MTSPEKELRTAALALPTEQRAELVAELLASLDGDPEDDVEAAWAAEIEARIRTVRERGSRGRDWATVRAELHASRPSQLPESSG